MTGDTLRGQRRLLAPEIRSEREGPPVLKPKAQAVPLILPLPLSLHLTHQPLSAEFGGLQCANHVFLRLWHRGLADPGGGAPLKDSQFLETVKDSP